MANISVSNTFVNGTAADATQVNQNFTDIINGTSDGTKDFSISALTCAGNVNLNANVTLGNASGDDVTFTGSLASSIPIKTDGTYDIGSAALGLQAVYFGDAGGNTVNIQAPAIAANFNFVLPGFSMTLPSADGSADQVLSTNGSGTMSFATRAKIADLKHRNLIINGNFDIWQRGTSFSSPAGNSYQADRFSVGYTTTGTVDINRSTTVPTTAESGYDSTYSYQVDVTGTDTSIAAADIFHLKYNVEGYDATAIYDQDMTLTFWVYATKTGTYTVGFTDASLSANYVAEYTVSSSNTWEKKTITVTHSTSSGTWDTTTGKGLRIFWNIMAGSNNHTTAGSWLTDGKLSTSNQVNALDSTSNVFHLSQVMLVRGDTAAGTFKLAGELIADELALCQRYYQVNDAGYVSYAISASTVESCITFPVEMRATPSVGTTGTLQFTDGVNPAATQSSANATAINFTASGGRINHGNLSGLTTYRPYGQTASTNQVTFTSEP